MAAIEPRTPAFGYTGINFAAYLVDVRVCVCVCV